MPNINTPPMVSVTTSTGDVDRTVLVIARTTAISTLMVPIRPANAQVLPSSRVGEESLSHNHLDTSSRF